MLSLATMGAGRYNFSCFNRMLLRLFTIAVIMLSLPLGFSAGSEAQEISGYKVALRNFVFSHPTPLSVQEQKELARKLRAEDLEFSGDSWQGDFADYAAEYVKKAYQDRGYFLAKASCEVAWVDDESRTHRVDLFVAVHEGPQYRLREIHWKNMTAFSETQLLAAMPIHSGEIFSRGKIVAGLEAVRKLYGSLGYSNFTCIPNTQIDEADRTIALDIDVDEGGVFHWGDLHVQGMEDRYKEVLLRGWEGVRDQLFTSSNVQELDRFLNRYFLPLRPGVNLSDYTTSRINLKARTVDVYLPLIPDPSLLQEFRKSRAEHR